MNCPADCPPFDILVETSYVDEFDTTFLPEAYYFFGTDVSISGNYALTGAHYNTNDFTGSVFIMKLNSSNAWEVVQWVNSSYDNVSGYGFVNYMLGDYAIIGSPFKGDTIYGDFSGRAYVLKRNSGTDVWEEIQEIQSDDMAGGDHFGDSISMFGEYAVIGAIGKDGYTGAVYVFKRNIGCFWWVLDCFY